MCVSVVTYPTCGLTKVRVSVTICMGLCRCDLAKEFGLDRGDGWGMFPPGDFSVGITVFPLHFPMEAGLLCLRL